jgi:hypothetical protein
MRALRVLALLAVLVAAASVSAHADEPGLAPIGGQATIVRDASAQMTLVPRAAEDPEPFLPAACCKICSKGKACGDSCISRKKTCHKQPGCACDAQ